MMQKYGMTDIYFGLKPIIPVRQANFEFWILNFELNKVATRSGGHFVQVDICLVYSFWAWAFDFVFVGFAYGLW